MRAFLLTLAVALGPAAFAEPPELTPAEAGRAARIRGVLDATRVRPDDVPEKAAVADLLKALGRKLPPGEKITLGVDEGGLGADAKKVAAAVFERPAKGDRSIAAYLDRIVEWKPGGVEIDYAIRPDGTVLLTRPALAACTVSYDVGDIVPHLPRLLPALRSLSQGDDLSGIRPDDGPGLLARAVCGGVPLRAGETAEVRNRARLVVTAAPARQQEVRSLLDVVRRLADTGVYMNARLYEVDRDFFNKEVAPVFAKPREGGAAPGAAAVDGPLLKKLVGKKLVQVDEETKLWPDQPAPFLARQTVFRYHPVPDKVGTGLAGVTFAVRPRVSPDRRFLRLHLTQHAEHLAGIDRHKVSDVETRKVVEVERPDVRAKTSAGTVTLADGNPFVMPVEYPPPGKDGDRKVWLLVARPVIWIEEEAAEFRKNGGPNVSPRTIWAAEVSVEDPPAPAALLPSDDDHQAVLQAVLTAVLTLERLHNTRETYGTTRDKTLTLSDRGKHGWPKQFRPATHGRKLVRPDPFDTPRRVLGIRIDRFDLKHGRAESDEGAIEVFVFNAGGSENGGADGGCFVSFNPKKVDGKWTVEFVSLLDP